MTFEIALVLAILAVSLVLFVTEWIRMDVTALLVLGALAVTGLVKPADAFAGFSNPAVITVWAMFILSEGLTRTGVANVIGRQVMRMAGTGEVRLIFVVMIVAGVLSAFMNNIGVAALMLPVVISVARKTGTPAPRLLMPLAFATLLGGLTTLIGTPPNLLVSGALREAGMQPFRLFDFAPVGVAAMVAGTAFMAFVGRHLLPRTDPVLSTPAAKSPKLIEQYALRDRVYIMRLGGDSLMAGTKLGRSRLGSALGLNLLAILRDRETLVAPRTDTVLKAGDRLAVQGQLDRLEQLRGWREFAVAPAASGPFGGSGLEMAEVRIAPGSPLSGRTLAESDFRKRHGLHVLKVNRVAGASRAELLEGDHLVVQGTTDRIEAAAKHGDFDKLVRGPKEETARFDAIHRRIFEVSVPADSAIAGMTLAESRLGAAFGLQVIGIVRDGEQKLLPGPDERLVAGDRLTIHGEEGDLRILRGLQELAVESESHPDLSFLENDQVGIVEASLSPRSKLDGRSVRDLQFRERFKVQIIAIWRRGRAHRSALQDMKVQIGDALLLLGRRDDLALLQNEDDFLVLTPVQADTFRSEKAGIAAAIMAAVLLPVLFGWISIAVAAVIGVAAMVVLGCLRMEEAYGAIEWKAVFLIAGMIPLGVAMHETGAAEYIAAAVVGQLGQYGPWAVLFGLYAITAIATTIVPTAALVLLMAPIVLQSCADMGVSPYAGMMAIAMAASASFTSPISHPANILVMGPGGYRFVDYIKLGVPLALVVAAAVMLTLPFFWPLHP